MIQETYFFVKLADSYKIFTRLIDAEKIIFIFSNTDGNVSKLCASFLYKVTQKDTNCIVEPPLFFKYQYHFISII